MRELISNELEAVVGGIFGKPLAPAEVRSFWNIFGARNPAGSVSAGGFPPQRRFAPPKL
jgi:hypothetical protein